MTGWRMHCAGRAAGERSAVRVASGRRTPVSWDIFVQHIPEHVRSVDDITAGLVDEAADLELSQALSDHNQLQAIQSAYADVTSVGADALSNGDLPIVSATLLEAAETVLATHPDVEFLVIGHGPDKPALRDWARDHGILPRITFSPSSRGRSHPLGNLDILVEPSHEEGLGLSVMQGMALGIPVVAT